MKSIALLATLLAAAPSAAAEPAWEKFAPAEAGFAVSFPGKPTAEAETDFTKLGTLRRHSAVLDLAGVRYAVSSRDLPVVPNLPAPRTRLKGMRDGVVGADGKVLQDEEVSLGKRRALGRALLIERGGKHERVHLFLHGERIFDVRVVGTRAEVGSKHADRFIGSFEIND